MPDRKRTGRAGTACQDHLGNQYPSISAMARAYGISPATLNGRLKKGLSIETALTMLKKSGPGVECQDHLGNRYPSLSAMVRAYGVSYTVYTYRTGTCGWSTEKALTEPVTDTDTAGAHACTDHMGNRFPSKKAMCEHWHVPRNVYFTRKKAGKSLAQCLSPVMRRRASQQDTVSDHLGNSFPNLDGMCAHWGILKSDYIQNIRNNLPLSRALTERTERPERPRDHLGQEYPSINAMCRQWGITKTVLRSRLELGWTLEQILTHPENNSHLIGCTDHLGNSYPSQKAMLDAWHVSYTVYKHRLSKGCTLSEALDPKSRHVIPVTDHEGHAFPCLQSMLDYWSANTATYHHRTEKQGMDIRTALTTVNPGQDMHDGTHINDVIDGWVHATDRSGSYVASVAQMFRFVRQNMLLDRIASGRMPKDMRARHLSGQWFQVWNTARTGPSPGAVMDSDSAWLELCLAPYETEDAAMAAPSQPTGRETKNGDTDYD